MSQVPLRMPGLGRPVESAPLPLRYRVRGDALLGVPIDLWVFDVGLACCAVEFVAATMAHPELEPSIGSPDPAGDDGSVQVMVVSGTLTDTMTPVVLDLYRRLTGPVRVVSFGSCANSGGPYWDSYCVTKGIDQILPVDVYVPGCPPRPESLLHGLRLLAAGLDTASRS